MIGILRRASNVFGALGFVLLAACGGGGGGGSSGGTSGGNPAPSVPQTPTESRASREFPDAFAVSIAEDTDPFVAYPAGTFDFYAPDDETPTDLVLIGADGYYFQVYLDISAPDANGVRQITLSVLTIATYNFEDPIDENEDNVFEFEIQGTYKNEVLSAEITVNLTDVLDSAETDGKALVSDALFQPLGAQLEVIPDLTGDGASELGVPVLREQNGETQSFLFTGDFLQNLDTGMTEATDVSDFGTRFLQNQTDGQFEHNYLSALPAPAGTGVDLLISEAARDRLLLLNIASASDYNALRGNLDPDLISGAITYTFNDGQHEGRLIGDVNGDGVNDILVRPMEGSNTPLTFGIIFGETLAMNPATVRDGTLDVSFTTTRINQFWRDSFIEHLVLTARLLPDADGDGHGELVIAATGYDKENSFWYLRTGALTQDAVINLDALSTDQGYLNEYLEVASITETSDYDGDGIGTIILGNSRELCAIDGDDLSVGLNPLIGGPVCGPNSYRITRSSVLIGGKATDIGDLDGDGLNEIVTVSYDDATVISGAMLAEGQTVNVTGRDDIVTIDLRSFTPSQPRQAVPVYLEGANLIVFGIWNGNLNQYTPGEAGRVVIVDRNEVARAFNGLETELLVRR